MTTSDTTEAPVAHSPEPWTLRLHQILALRDSARTNPGSWRKTRAELRRGASPHTEQYAYPYVLPWAGENASRHRQTALLRLFALVAEFDDIPQFSPENGKYLSFGSWCYRVSVALAKSRGDSFTNDPEDPDAVAQRLQFLHTLDTEQAILNASRIMQLANGLGANTPPLDYFDLFRTFLRWGNGFTPQSQAVRRRLLRDYYAAYSPSATDPNAPKTSAASENQTPAAS